MSSYGGVIKDALNNIFVVEQNGKWYYHIDPIDLVGPYDTYEEAREAWSNHISE